MRCSMQMVFKFHLWGSAPVLTRGSPMLHFFHDPRSRELVDEKSSKFPAAFGGQEGRRSRRNTTDLIICTLNFQ